MRGSGSGVDEVTGTLFVGFIEERIFEQYSSPALNPNFLDAIQQT